MKPSMKRQIAQTGIIHRPLPIETEHALETLAKKKQVLSSRTLFSSKQHVSLEFTHQGAGDFTISGQDEIKLSSPVVMPHWPAGARMTVIILILVTLPYRRRLEMRTGAALIVCESKFS